MDDSPKSSALSVTSKHSELSGTGTKDELILHKVDNFAKVALGEMNQSQLSIFKKTNGDNCEKNNKFYGY